MGEPQARLACYDAIPLSDARAPAIAPAAPSRPGASAPAPGIATPAPSVAPTPAAPEAGFGLRAPVAELPSIASHIPGSFRGWGPNSIIRLANGQVWQIADDSSRMMERTDPKVTVRRGALNSFFLDFEGDNRSPQVRRLQ